MTAKQQLAAAIQALPEETSLDEAVRRLYQMYRSLRGMAASRSDDAGAGEDFWSEPTIQELAEEQDVAIPQRLEDLVGQGSDLWADQAEFEAFLGEIDQRRRAA